VHLEEFTYPTQITMNKIYPIILIFNLLAIAGLGQDRIVKTTGDTIRCQIREIGDDEVKYSLKEFKSDVIFGIDKNKVIRIIFSDGKELAFENSMFGPGQYTKQHKNALKVGFLSPLFGATSFTYERSVKPGNSWEASLGIIGLGTDIGGNSARGAYFKFGYKFIKSPDFYSKGTRFEHLLKGTYIRPEISLATYSVESTLLYDLSGGALTNGGARETNTMYALMINLGKQWVISDQFLIDWFWGIGYGTGHAYQNLAWHYAFAGGVSSFPIAITTGIRIGFLF